MRDDSRFQLHRPKKVGTLHRARNVSSNLRVFFQFPPCLSYRPIRQLERRDPMCSRFQVCDTAQIRLKSARSRQKLGKKTQLLVL